MIPETGAASTRQSKHKSKDIVSEEVSLLQLLKRANPVTLLATKKDENVQKTSRSQTAKQLRIVGRGSNCDLNFTGKATQ